MKKILKILPAFVFVLFVACLSGCLFTISAPQLTLNGNIISWGTDSNAQKYELILNDKSILTNENSINLNYYVDDSGAYTAKVKAFSKNMFYNDSDYSEALVFNVSESKLNAPTNVQVSSANYKYTATWNSVSGASGYILKLVNNTTKKITYVESATNSKDITADLSQTGKFIVFVRAVSSDLTTLAPSAYASSEEFEWATYINTPVISLSGTSLTWPSVDGAKEYIVATQEGKTKKVTSTSLNIATSGLLSENNFTAFFVQAIADEGRGYDSPYSDGIAYIPNISQTDLEGTHLEYMNTAFDLCANDADELQAIAFYSMFYRIKDIKFRISYTSSYDSAIHDELVKYGEIMSVSYTASNLGGLINLKITFSHPNTPTLKAEGNITVVQDDNIVSTSYTSTPRSDDFDDFLIETRPKALTVFNSDQLYVALQNGYRPIFTSLSSPAKAVYDAAKEVLRDIIDDSMTELEKVNAIYDWLSYTVRYDYNLLNYTEELESSTRKDKQAELAKYKGFYIEGVLFDGGQAVCDGISKTFVLLTNLENITSYKVSGTASGGNHAWNKIALDLNGDTEKEWYTVDVTWGDVTVKNGNVYTEYLSHSYYLVTDDMITINSHVEESPLTDDSETVFSYYQNKSLTYGLSTQCLFITSQADLTKLMTIVSNLGLEGIEFAVADDSSVSTGIYGSSYNIQRERLKTKIASKTYNPLLHDYEYTYNYLNIYCFSKK